MVAASSTAVASCASTAITAGRPSSSPSANGAPDSRTVSAGGTVSRTTATTAWLARPSASVATTAIGLPPSARSTVALKLPPPKTAAMPFTVTAVRCGSATDPDTGSRTVRVTEPSTGEVISTSGGCVSTTRRCCWRVIRPEASSARSSSAFGPSLKVSAGEVNGRQAPSGLPSEAGTPATVTATASADTRPLTETAACPSSAPSGGCTSPKAGGERSIVKAARAVAASAPEVAVTSIACSPSTPYDEPSS